MCFYNIHNIYTVHKAENQREPLISLLVRLLSYYHTRERLCEFDIQNNIILRRLCEIEKHPSPRSRGPRVRFSRGCTCTLVGKKIRTPPQ